MRPVTLKLRRPSRIFHVPAPKSGYDDDRLGEPLMIYLDTDTPEVYDYDEYDDYEQSRVRAGRAGYEEISNSKDSSNRRRVNRKRSEFGGYSCACIREQYRRFPIAGDGVKLRWVELHLQALPVPVAGETYR